MFSGQQEDCHFWLVGSQFLEKKHCQQIVLVHSPFLQWICLPFLPAQCILYVLCRGQNHTLGHCTHTIVLVSGYSTDDSYLNVLLCRTCFFLSKVVWWQLLEYLSSPRCSLGFSAQPIWSRLRWWWQCGPRKLQGSPCPERPWTQPLTR